MTYILLHISTIYRALHSIMELKEKNYSVKIRNSMIKHLYIQIKICLLSILLISLQIQYNLNLKIFEDRNHYRLISSVHKTYRHISHCRVVSLYLTTERNFELSRACNLLVDTFLQTKRRVRRNV